MALQFVKPAGFSHVNVVLYGPPGTGKTVGATTAPDRVLLVNADRPNASAMAHRLRPGKIDEVRPTETRDLDEIVALASKGDHRSVVVDTVGDLYRLVLADVSNNALAASLAQYRDAGTLVERFLLNLFDLPVTVVAVAHDVTDEDGTTWPLVGTAGRGGFARSRRLMGAADIVGFCARVTPDDDPSGAEFVAQLATAKGRAAKDRTGALAPVEPIDITAWIRKANQKGDSK